MRTPLVDNDINEPSARGMGSCGEHAEGVINIHTSCVVQASPVQSQISVILIPYRAYIEKAVQRG